jgi:hypothetical protein
MTEQLRQQSPQAAERRPMSRLALWVPIIRPCWSGSMPVFVEGAAQSVSSADIEVRDPLNGGSMV